MKSVMRVLVLMIMVFALVSIGEVGTGYSNNDNSAVFVQTHNAPAGANVRDADNPGYLPAGTPYSCIASPAYTDYIDARAVPCPLNEKDRRVPDPMGSPGW